MDTARNLTVEERGKLLEGDSSFTDVHETLALEEPAERHPDGENHHFIALVQKDGELYELDGRKSFPIKHGPTTDESFLQVDFDYLNHKSAIVSQCKFDSFQDAARVCKEFMARDPDELRFTVGAIAATQKD